MILAIDTATQFASLALYDHDGIYAEETWFTGRRHTTELMPRIVRMLQLANLKVTQLQAIAVSLGPGSFTGVRIGLAVAKGIALPHKLPVIGVPTLDIMAYPLQHDDLPVWAVVQAGRDRILVACYDHVNNQWQQIIEPFLTTIEELGQKITENSLCVGEVGAEATQLLHQISLRKINVVPPAQRLRRAGYLAEIALARLKIKDYKDSKLLAPIYPASAT